MRKKSILCLLIVSLLSLTGCTNSETESASVPDNTISYLAPTPTDFDTPFVLSDTTLFNCPFITTDESLFFPNLNDDNNISKINYPLPDNLIKTEDVDDFINYPSYSMTLLDGKLYFSNESDYGKIYSVTFDDKTPSLVLTDKAKDIIGYENSLYFINKDDNYKLYSYDCSDRKSTRLNSSH